MEAGKKLKPSFLMACPWPWSASQRRVIPGSRLRSITLSSSRKRKVTPKQPAPDGRRFWTRLSRAGFSDHRHLADAHRAWRNRIHRRLVHQRPRFQHRPRLPPASHQRAVWPLAANSFPRSKSELPTALTHLQRGNIAPVDLAPGRHRSLAWPFTPVTPRCSTPTASRCRYADALALINQTLDEVLTEQEGDFDADTRWAVAWFEQCGFDEGDYGVAETLSKAKNTSVAGLVEAGILVSRGGKVRLLKPNELPDDWNPTADPRLTAWETVHHLVRTLESGGESAAAELTAVLGSTAETARELCYRLYTLCERKKRAAEALSYNALVQSWPEIARLAQARKSEGEQDSLFESRENSA